MPKNNSNREKTFKNKMRAMPGDFWVIDNISLYSNYLDMAVLPDGFILDDYKDHFDQFVEEIELDEKYYYTPSLFAHEYYGAAELDFLVLYFANMSTLFDFKTKTIKVLPITSLTDLNRLIVEYKAQVKDSKANPTPYEIFDPIKYSDLKEKEAQLIAAKMDNIVATTSVPIVPTASGSGNNSTTSTTDINLKNKFAKNKFVIASF